MLNIDALLAPIGPDQPCGEDLAFSPEVDEIARARQADDPSLEQGAWVAALKEADWKFVGKRCALLIETRSKHLQLAVWLAEASAKTASMAGLAQGLRLVAALCERYWEGLHPVADEDGFERRIGNLAWLAARIAPLARDLAVSEDGSITLATWEGARGRGAELLAELEAARARSSASFCRSLHQDAEACLAALDALEAAVDAHLGSDGPSFGAARAALRDVADFVAPNTDAPEPKAGPQAAGTGLVLRSAPAAAYEGPVLQREQALVQLRQVAEFFRRTEPHSPVAYLAEKAARWGEQPLHAWLRSVIKDEVSLSRLEELLGIESEKM